MAGHQDLALDLADVAAGRFDGFWEQHLSAWDLAAGVLGCAHGAEEALVRRRRARTRPHHLIAQALGRELHAFYFGHAFVVRSTP